MATSLMIQLALLFSGVAGARILGVLDRGRSALFIILATVIPIISSLGMPLSVTYWIAQNRQIGRRLLLSLGRVFAAQMIGTLLLHAAVLLIVFRRAPADVQVAAAVSLLASPAILAWSYGLAVLQGAQQFRALNGCRIFFPPFYALGLLALLVTGAGDLLIVTIVWVFLYCLTAVITGRAAWRALPEPLGTAELPSVRTLSTFGLKGWLGSVTPLEGFQLDQVIVGLFISQAALGIYVVAVAFTNLPRFVSQGIGLVAYPNIAAEKGGPHRGRRIVMFATVTVVLCGAIIVATEVALPFLVPRLFGHAFAAATGVARILLISTLLFALRRVLSECARGAGRPLLGTVAEAVSLVLLAPCVLVFAPSSGLASGRQVAWALVVIGVAGVATIVAGLLRPSPAA